MPDRLSNTPNRKDSRRFDRLVAGAALSVEEPQQFPKALGIGRIPHERALPGHFYQVFVLKFVQMMGKSRSWDIEFGPDIASDQAFEMRAANKARIIRRRGSVPIAKNISP
jgi:hypothetical protein